MAKIEGSRHHAPIHHVLNLLAVQFRCWLGARELGVMVEWHHPVPKSRGGRAVEPVHPICHRAIHASLDNKTLAKIGADAPALRQRPELADFLRWVAGKPSDFHAPTQRRRG